MEKEFEKKHDPIWSCFVGRGLSYDTDKFQYFVDFSIAQFRILVFKYRQVS